MANPHPSLELLLAGYRPSSAHSSPESTNTTTSGSSDDMNSDIAAELQRISRSFEEAFKAGSETLLDELSNRYIAPSFVAKFDTAMISSWHDYAVLMRRWTDANPNFQKSVISTSIDIDVDEKHATVYLLMEVIGWPVQLRRLVVSVLKWKKRKRRWLCYENQTMRGIDTFDTANGHLPAGTWSLHHRSTENSNLEFLKMEITSIVDDRIESEAVTVASSIPWLRDMDRPTLLDQVEGFLSS